MKSIFTALTIVFLFATSNAQNYRYVDLNVEIANPDCGFTVYSPGVDSCLVQIVNNGPHTLKPGDEFFITLKFGGLRYVGKTYSVTKQLGAGDTTFIKCFFMAKGTNDATGVELCVHEAYALTPPESQLDSSVFFEKKNPRQFKDNSFCVVGDHKMNGNSSILQLDQFDSDIRVYPNPTNGYITVDVPENDEIQEIQVLTLNGSRVYEVSEVMESQKASIDLSV